MDIFNEAYRHDVFNDQGSYYALSYLAQWFLEFFKSI